MLDLLATLLTGQFSAHLRALARKIAFAAVTLVFALIALTAGSVAGFLALDAAVGPLRAALILAVCAAALAGLFSIPLWLRPAPPPPSAAASLIQLALAVGLGILADRKPRAEPPPPA